MAPLVLRKLSILAAAFSLFCSATTVPAQVVPVNKCASAKTKCVAAFAKSTLGCHAKAETKGTSLDSLCTDKAVTKFIACMVKADAKPPCPVPADWTAPLSVSEIFVFNAVTQLDPGYPAPVVNKCSAGKKKAVAAKAAAKLGCLAKAFAKTGTVDPSCLAKAEAKHLAAFAKLEAKPPCLTAGDEAALEATVDAYYGTMVTVLTVETCGNGTNDVGEACDASAPSSGWGACGADFTCVDCNCACPTRYEVVVDGNDPKTVMDLGWRGIGHREPLATDATFTVGLGSCTGTERPCGSCTVTGPIPNGSGKLANRRCTNDTSIHCTTDGPCLGGGGTCQYFLGPWQGISYGGVGVCVAYQYAMPAGGTVNVENGEVALPMDATMLMQTGPGVDTPCPRCLGDLTPDDGAANGVCNGGARNGLACDANGTTPGFPDFGTTSLDCPPSAPFSFKSRFTLDNVTDPDVMTVNAASPDCRGLSGEKCLCDTCNNANAEPCASNAECPDPAGPIGPVCGGKRCVGGANDGAPCSTSSECPGGLCGVPGYGTAPTYCADDTSAPGVFQCADTPPVDGEGACLAGPFDSHCTIASGHPQRGCSSDADCGGGLGTCDSFPFPCFLTGTAVGFGTRVGTQTLIAAGAEDVPVRDVSHPTLGSASCMSVTGASFFNDIFGFPGPQRTTLRVTARALP